MRDHRQQRLDVVHHRLHPGADRLKAGQPQQVERCGSQRGHDAGAIPPVAVGVPVELGVANPVPALNAPAVPHQLHQGFWGGAQGCVAPRGAPWDAAQMSGTEGLAVTSTGGR